MGLVLKWVWVWLEMVTSHGTSRIFQDMHFLCYFVVVYASFKPDYKLLEGSSQALFIFQKANPGYLPEHVPP